MSDSSSSPEPPKEPKFQVESIELSQRDEDEEDKFVIISVKNPDKTHKYRVTRSFHDFQFLEYQLFRSGQDLAGYILPPFPSQSTSQPTSPETSQGKPLPGYGRFVSDELQLFHWLQVVLEHPIFGHSGLLDPFLTEKVIPPPGKIGKSLGIIKSIQDTIDSRKYAHKDCDLFFQTERDWSIKVHELMQSAAEAFNSTINARHSLSQVLAHFSAALCIPMGEKNELSQVALQNNLNLSRALECYKEFVEAETCSQSATLGASLIFWTQFIESEKEMLKQRTCLLVDYESANRRLDKARGQRRPEIEEAKIGAERAFEKCSNIARGEIKRFQNMRTKALGKVLTEYRNSQLAIANEFYQQLSLACKI